jgi:hypothetical protein
MRREMGTRQMGQEDSTALIGSVAVGHQVEPMRSGLAVALQLHGQQKELVDRYSSQIL